MWILECIVLVMCIICMKVMLNLFNVFNSTGKECLKVANYCKYENLKYFGIVLILTVGALFIQFCYMIEGLHIAIITSYLIMFVLLIISIVGMKDKIGIITSKGCWHERGFFSWKSINEYKWLKEDCIEFHGVSKLGRDVVYHVENIIVPKEQLDNTLEKFIK